MFTRLIVRLLSEMAGVFGSVSFDATTLLLMNELGHGCGLKIIFGLKKNIYFLRVPPSTL